MQRKITNMETNTILLLILLVLAYKFFPQSTLIAAVVIGLAYVLFYGLGFIVVSWQPILEVLGFLIACYVLGTLLLSPKRS